MAGRYFGQSFYYLNLLFLTVNGKTFLSFEIFSTNFHLNGYLLKKCINYNGNRQNSIAGFKEQGCS